VINRAGPGAGVSEGAVSLRGWSAHQGAMAGGGRPEPGKGGGSKTGTGVPIETGLMAGSEPVLDPSRVLASIPDDPEVEKADLEARPIVSIPVGSPAKLAVAGLAERVLALCRARD